MNKAEFLQELERRLHVLNDQERKDVLEEYAQHIDMKIENGQSEEEAVRDFGSFDELIAELLEAYHINSEYASETARENDIHPSESGRAQEGVPEQSASGLQGMGKKIGQAAHTAAGAVRTAGAKIFLWIRKFCMFWVGLFASGWFWIRKTVCRLIGRPIDQEDEARIREKEEKRRRMQEERVLRREERRRQREENRERGRQLQEQRKNAGHVCWLLRLWNGCVCAVKTITIFLLRAALLCMALPFFLTGLLFLFLTGTAAVLMLLRYPVAGVGIAVFGLTLCLLGCAGLLLSWAFPGKCRQDRHNRTQQQDEK